MTITRRLVSVALLPVLLASAAAQTTTEPKTTKMQSNATNPAAKEIVQQFFTAFGKGDLEGLVATFHENNTITAVRSGTRTNHQLYGTYQGKAGVREFVGNLGNAFATKAFTVECIAGEGDTAFATGKFTHEVKATGKLFASDWALLCVTRDGKIFEYHFYEDSAAFLEANRK
jgi:ketosteroid isomerase-like protein